jgi:uncharacterized membrane protein (DUF373 family)
VERGIPYTGVNRFARRFLEVGQDFIVVGLIIVLFALMVRTLARLSREVVTTDFDFRNVISEVLFMLVMVELVRLLLVYLREHHVAMDFMVELGIVSILREVVLKGVVELDWEQIIAISVFLLVLGVLLRYGDIRPRHFGLAGHRSSVDSAAEPEAISRPTSLYYNPVASDRR